MTNDHIISIVWGAGFGFTQAFRRGHSKNSATDPLPYRGTIL